MSVDLLVLVHGVVDADIVGPMLGPLLRVQTGSFGGNSGLLADWIESSDALRLYVAEELRGHLKRTRYDPDAVADGRIFAPSTRHQCMTLGRLTIVEKHAKG